MKNPLHYQLSAYDCGPTTMLNAVSYLFEREEIPPELIRNIMLYSLDCYGKGDAPCKAGTSRMAMMFLANWLDGYGQATSLPLSSVYLAGQAVSVRPESRVLDALHRGGVAVVRLFYEVEHYTLFTGVTEHGIELFDPWYVPADSQEFAGTGIELTLAHPFAYNRVVPFSCFECENCSNYALGTIEDREAVLLFNGQTKRTAADTIEYFI